MRPRLTPQLNPQAVTTSGTSAQSTAFGAGSHYARLVCTKDCYIAFGTSPTATSSGIYLVAGVPEFFGITPGQKVAALQVATGGVLSIVEGLQF